MFKVPPVPETPQTLNKPLVGRIYDACGSDPANLDRPTIVVAAARVAAALLISRFGGEKYLQQFTVIDLSRYDDNLDLSDEVHGEKEDKPRGAKSLALAELELLQGEELGWWTMGTIRKAIRQELAIVREGNWRRALVYHDDKLVTGWRYLDGQYRLRSTFGHGGSEPAQLRLEKLGRLRYSWDPILGVWRIKDTGKDELDIGDREELGFGAQDPETHDPQGESDPSLIGSDPARIARIVNHGRRSRSNSS